MRAPASGVRGSLAQPCAGVEGKVVRNDLAGGSPVARRKRSDKVCQRHRFGTAHFDDAVHRRGDVRRRPLPRPRHPTRSAAYRGRYPNRLSDRTGLGDPAPRTRRTAWPGRSCREPEAIRFSCAILARSSHFEQAIRTDNRQRDVMRHAAATSAARRLRLEVSKNSSTALSSNEGEFATSRRPGRPPAPRPGLRP